MALYGKNGVGKFARIDEDDYIELSKRKWRLTTFGYVVSTIPKTTRVVWLHRIVAKTPSGMDTDHINMNRLDNRKANLRHCTRSQNMRNSVSKRNKSGQRGVSWHKGANKWIVQLRVNYTRHYLGVYESFDEAVEVYRKAAKELHGEYTRV